MTNKKTNEAVRSLCSKIAKACQVEMSSLWMIDIKDKNKLCFIGGYGREINNLFRDNAYYSINSDDGLTPWVLRQGVPFIVKDNIELRSNQHHRGRFDALLYKYDYPEGFQNMLAIPIQKQTSNGVLPIGVLKVENKINQQNFSVSDQIILKTFADFILTNLDEELNFSEPLNSPLLFIKNHDELKAFKIVILDVEKEMIQYFSRYPDEMYRMSPRKFEELIAAIFNNNGYKTNLTPQTRDGGFDIYAFKNDNLVGDNIYLIECKRYSPENKVNIAVVDRLLGVVNRRHATKGIIASTSTFTKDAVEIANSNKNIISLAAYDVVKSWLNNLSTL